MILYVVIALVLFVSISPLTQSDKRVNHLRNRRMFTSTPTRQQKRDSPFIIRVPHSKVVNRNPLFSYSTVWKAKQSSASVNSPKEEQPDLEVTQFHSQDINGQIVFGFNSPDQMRIETRNADGTVHGTYSYLDPNGEIIKRQYWDTGSGFHVTSNIYALSNGLPSEQIPQYYTQYTPEVQPARGLHFQLYQQALASLLPTQRIRDMFRRNNDTINIGESSTSLINNSSPLVSPSSTPSQSSNAVTNQFVNDENSNSTNFSKLYGLNGSVVIQNPEYLRISWTTYNKKYHFDSYNNTDIKLNSLHTRTRNGEPNVRNVTEFSIENRVN